MKRTWQAHPAPPDPERMTLADWALAIAAGVALCVVAYLTTLLVMATFA